MSRHVMRGLLVLVAVGLAVTFGIQCNRTDEVQKPSEGLPKLVDLGAKTCIPCKKMAPILDELKTEYAGKFDVEFIDVSVDENLPRAEKYKIDLIPTQVFLGADGKELWRHEGFMDKDAILGKWEEFGYKWE